jgi:hypothetical protein
MRRIKQVVHSTRGQNLVEFALIAPVMFLLLFGIIDFGLFLHERITIQHAVREGARYGAVHAACPDIQKRTSEEAHGLFAEGDVTVWYEQADGSATSVASAGDTVKISVPFVFKTPLLPRFGLSPTLDVEASARLEMAVPNAGGCGP